MGEVARSDGRQKKTAEVVQLVTAAE